VQDGAARRVSLTEKVQREAMHPADQFEAFAALVAEGHPVEDIAADFGVSPLVVQRRLKLANVSPRLLADHRLDAVTLDQLMALAIADDHAAHEAAFYDSPQWQRSPDALRHQLTQDELSASSDALARFVGLDAYEAAGGAVRRDLFSDEQEGAYLTDPALLDRLAHDKLADTAEQVRGVGWAWIDVVPRRSPSGRRRVACTGLHLREGAGGDASVGDPDGRGGPSRRRAQLLAPACVRHRDFG
jgi:ParB family chromosome partitioning protein